MTPNSRSIGCLGLVAVGEVGIAFWAAPRSCDGGLEIYAAAGIAAAVVAASLPFVLRSGESTARRVGWSLAFVLLGAAAWVGGLFLANVRLLCRLF